MLQITVPKGILDLPKDVELSIDEVNVLWSDETSHSLPVKVSYTNHNLALLGHPERWENATQEVNIACAVTHSNFRKQGVIKFVSINKEDKTLEFSMLLDEGVWFEWAKNTKLQSGIVWPKPITVTYATTGAPDVVFKAKKEALEKLTENAWPVVLPDYYDPAILKAEFTDCAFLSAIKEWEQGAGYTENMWGVTGTEDTYHMAKYDIVNKYGLAVGAATPLLFIRTVLKYLFAGWQVENNPFLVGDLARAFIFNDSITYFENGSKIDYSKLVPDETIEKFISLCEGISGTKMVIDPINKITTFVGLDQKLRSKSKAIKTPLTVNTKEVDIKQFSLNSNVIDCDYSQTYDECNEALLKSGKIKIYPTINWQHQLLRNQNDDGQPWDAVTAYPEQIIFDRATQCFGIEKWIRKENDKWTFNRSMLSHRFYPNTYGSGDSKHDLDINSVAMNAIVAFSQYFLDATGNELNMFAFYVMHLPFYPCRYESSNDYMHDFEKIFFNKTENTGKLAVSIQRGLHRVYWRKNQYNVMIRQEGERDEYDDWGTESEAYTDNRCYFKFANSDIYDIEGQLAVSDVKTADASEYFLNKRGRLAPSDKPLSLRASGENGLFETYYRTYARFIANQVPAEIADNCNELNRTSIHEKVSINGQNFVITKRKHVLTLHTHKISTTELAAVVL
jgi:hypothetical protein